MILLCLSSPSEVFVYLENIINYVLYSIILPTM